MRGLIDANAVAVRIAEGDGDHAQVGFFGAVELSSHQLQAIDYFLEVVGKKSGDHTTVELVGADIKINPGHTRIKHFEAVLVDNGIQAQYRLVKTPAFIGIPCPEFDFLEPYFHPNRFDNW